MTKTLVALILDKSGSMSGIQEAARTNFNEQLQVLKKESEDPDVETQVSVITFNQDVDIIDFDIAVENITEITEDEYSPGGMTALYDAIGLTISKFEKEYTLDDETGVLFTIITDGMENSSKEYVGEEGRLKLKAKIDELEKTGKWTFTFMGTEEALSQASGIGITSSMQFTATANGLKQAVDLHNLSSSEYYSIRKTRKVTAVKDFYKNK